jgi:hypothetical protein
MKCAKVRNLNAFSYKINGIARNVKKRRRGAEIPVLPALLANKTAYL